MFNSTVWYAQCTKTDSGVDLACGCSFPTPIREFHDTQTSHVMWSENLVLMCINWVYLGNLLSTQPHVLHLANRHYTNIPTPQLVGLRSCERSCTLLGV